MIRVAVTGANGFVGRFLVQRLAELSAVPVPAHRRPPLMAAAAEHTILEASETISAMTGKLKGVDAIVHLAAVVHDVAGRTVKSEIFRVNLEWTRRLASAAAQAGVQRFVFGSTIKVNGESSEEGKPFDESSRVAPEGAYAESKYRAENALREMAARGLLQVTVLRTPLIYGPGVRANFFSLLRAVDLGIPLPFGAISNARSLLYVENYADFIARIAIREASTEFRTYLLSDGLDLSTAELIRNLAQALQRRARLFDIAPHWVQRAARLLGKERVARRLTGTLCVDSTKARRELDWLPPFTVEDGLRKTADWYRAGCR